MHETNSKSKAHPSCTVMGKLLHRRKRSSYSSRWASLGNHHPNLFAHMHIHIWRGPLHYLVGVDGSERSFGSENSFVDKNGMIKGRVALTTSNLVGGWVFFVCMWVGGVEGGLLQFSSSFSNIWREYACHLVWKVRIGSLKLKFRRDCLGAEVVIFFLRFAGDQRWEGHKLIHW